MVKYSHLPGPMRPNSNMSTFPDDLEAIFFFSVTQIKWLKVGVVP